MNRSTEIDLLEELARLREARSFHLDDAVATSSVARYACPERFSRERRALFHTLPAIVAHRSELVEPDSFEGALDRFNRIVEKEIEAGGA